MKIAINKEQEQRLCLSDVCAYLGSTIGQSLYSTGLVSGHSWLSMSAFDLKLSSNPESLHTQVDMIFFF